MLFMLWIIILRETTLSLSFFLSLTYTLTHTHAHNRSAGDHLSFLTGAGQEKQWRRLDISQIYFLLAISCFFFFVAAVAFDTLQIPGFLLCHPHINKSLPLETKWFMNAALGDVTVHFCCLLRFYSLVWIITVTNSRCSGMAFWIEREGESVSEREAAIERRGLRD